MSKGLGLKLISILSGSSEESLLNTRAEVSNTFGKGIMSNETERKYVFQRIASDMSYLFTMEELFEMKTYEVIGCMIEYYCKNGNKDFVI
jgi:hypothetical protein